MRHLRLIPKMAIGGMLVLLGGASLGAQSSIPTRPAQGLFRGDERNSTAGQTLHLSFSGHQTYDDNIINSDAGTSAVSTDARPRGFYSQALAELFYARRGNRATFAVSGGGALDYYPQLRAEVKQPVSSYNASSNILVPMGRGSIRGNVGVNYQSYFSLQMLPHPADLELPLLENASVPFRPDVAVLRQPAIMYNTAISARAPLNRSTSLESYYGYQGGSFDTQWSDLKSHVVGARMNFAARRYSSVHAGYSYNWVSFSAISVPPETLRSHDWVGGFNYVRPLSATRTVGFHASSGIALQEAPLLTRAAAGPRSDHHVLASAGLTYHFGRSWTVRGDYGRVRQLLQGLSDAYFGNNISFNVQGGVGRRVDVSSSVQYSRGGVLGVTDVGRYSARGGSVRMRYAITRTLAASAEYIHSSYDFRPDAALPSGIARVLDRNALRFGLIFGWRVLSDRSRP